MKTYSGSKRSSSHTHTQRSKLHALLLLEASNGKRATSHLAFQLELGLPPNTYKRLLDEPTDKLGADAVVAAAYRTVRMTNSFLKRNKKKHAERSDSRDRSPLLSK